MAYILNSNSLGEINSEGYNLDSDLDQFNFPASGTNEAEVFDYGDCKNIINISGRYTASSLENLANWIITMWALQDGDQDTIIFHSDLLDASTSGSYQDGNVLVKVKSFKPIYKGGIPLTIEYSFVLMESI